MPEVEHRTVPTDTMRRILFPALLLIAGAAYPHSGGLDSQGGHNDRAVGTYHFHQYLAVGRTTMYDLVGKGHLPTVRIGRCTRFRPEDLEDFIEAQLTRRSR